MNAKKFPTKTVRALYWIISILREEKIPFQITGGVAAHFYGATREIQDIDIDVPEQSLERIAKRTSEYIVFGPKHHKNSKWDLELLNLNYKGQEIDLGGAYFAKIFDAKTRKWKKIPAKFSTAKRKRFGKLVVPVAEPRSLIKYKTYYGDKYQKHDIEAIMSYLKK